MLTAVSRPHDGPSGDPPCLLASANPTVGARRYDPAMAKLQYQSKDDSGHRFWTARHGRYAIRIDPAESDAMVATTSAHLMEMRGRQMPGWLRVGPEDLRTKRQLAKWVELGTTYARSLPAKR